MIKAFFSKNPTRKLSTHRSKKMLENRLIRIKDNLCWNHSHLSKHFHHFEFLKLFSGGVLRKIRLSYKTIFPRYTILLRKLKHLFRDWSAFQTKDARKDSRVLFGILKFRFITIINYWNWCGFAQWIGIV